MGYNKQLGIIRRVDYFQTPEEGTITLPDITIFDKRGLYDLVSVRDAKCGVSCRNLKGVVQLNTDIAPGLYWVETNGNDYTFTNIVSTTSITQVYSIIFKYDMSKDKWTMSTIVIDSAEIADLKKRLASAESTIKDHTSRITSLETSVTNLSQRVAALEKAGS